MGLNSRCAGRETEEDRQRAHVWSGREYGMEGPLAERLVGMPVGKSGVLRTMHTGCGKWTMFGTFVGDSMNCDLGRNQSQGGELFN